MNFFLNFYPGKKKKVNRNFYFVFIFTIFTVFLTKQRKQKSLKIYYYFFYCFLLKIELANGSISCLGYSYYLVVKMNADSIKFIKIHI